MHVHTHDHTHDHTHAHTHDHAHDHTHAHNLEGSIDERKALLEYMLHHNESHLDDIKKLVEQTEGQTSIFLDEACEFYRKGNESLGKCIETIGVE
jgi:ABC-type nickel/cobalt efflux system permease component RcnA